MALTKDEAIRTVREFLGRAAIKHDIREAYLFGSYASGNPKDYSDIDLAVVLGTEGSMEQYDQKSYRVFHEAQEFNSLLEVLCFHSREFEENASTIVKRIKMEGIPIAILS